MYTTSDSVVYCEGEKLTIKGETAYDSNNNEVGNVWTLGSKNQKVYVLNNGNYSISGSSKFKVEYIDAGYYQQIAEYSISDSNEAWIAIPNFTSLSTITDGVINGVTVQVASIEKINMLNE